MTSWWLRGRYFRSTDSERTVCVNLTNPEQLPLDVGLGDRRVMLVTARLGARRALNHLRAEDTIALEARSPIGLSLLAI